MWCAVTPWSITCDFGETLAPHLLEAIGRDGKGRELDRATQRVNLPREPAEVSLALHGGEQGYRAVQIAWDAPGDVQPEEIHLYFDGEPIEVSGAVAALPPHDRLAMHVIAAELVFPGQVRATGELAFGGQFGEELRSELTAIPLERVDQVGLKRLPSAVEVEGWLRVGGAAPRIVAVERGPFELIVVRGEASLHPLRNLGGRTRSAGKYRRDDQLRFVSSRPLLVKAADGSWSALYSVSQNLNENGVGLARAMTRAFFGASQEGEIERLTDAVAVAGVRAAGSSRPRGVLLVTATRFAKETEPGVDPLAIRNYLAALRVPFFYWRIDESGDATPDDWGTPRAVRDREDLHRAASELASALRPQFLIWLDGEHMPGDVTTVAASSTPLRLAGGVVR